MTELNYENVMYINSLTKTIIAKTITLKDVNDMLRDLSNEKAEYQPEIRIASRMIRISPNEKYWMKGLLQACAAHLERDIESIKNEICGIFYDREDETEDDRDQPNPKTEV